MLNGELAHILSVLGFFENQHEYCASVLAIVLEPLCHIPTLRVWPSILMLFGPNWMPLQE